MPFCFRAVFRCRTWFAFSRRRDWQLPDNTRQSDNSSSIISLHVVRAQHVALTRASSSSTRGSSLSSEPHPRSIGNVSFVRSNISAASPSEASRGEAWWIGTPSPPPPPPPSPRALPSWTEFRERYLDSPPSPPEYLKAEDETTCPVCREEYTNDDESVPIRLPCLGNHLICRSCAQNWFRYAEELNHTQCPTCRQPVFRREARSVAPTLPRHQASQQSLIDEIMEGLWMFETRAVIRDTIQEHFGDEAVPSAWVIDDPADMILEPW